MFRILIPLKRWGIPPCPEEELTLPSDATMRQRVFRYAVTTYNPLAAVRIAGPIGPRLITNFRKDIERKFRHIFSDTSVVSKYLYHLNAQDPSGEIAFKALGRLFLYNLLIHIKEKPCGMLKNLYLIDFKRYLLPFLSPFCMAM
jgi:hypothetical protein